MKKVITIKAKEKLLKARNGEISLPIIDGIAIGDGGDGTTPEENENALKNELTRKACTSEKISDSCYRYRMVLEAEELPGKVINEAALYDKDGDLLAITVFSGKQKDSGMELAFEFDDKF